ncbi:30S ribosomal protein S27e [Candidatus Micrarchaeota archaeon]|nr:30S ribosomal protein S27e [Candidatus Micrarchaeota archaeon]
MKTPEDVMRLPESRFLRIRCNDCSNEQIVFGSAASEVSCLVCGKTVLKPTGGKAVVLAKIVKVLD